jgi:hypothetical protein
MLHPHSGLSAFPKELVYQAIVEQTDGTTNTYIGLTSSTFKSRLGVHTNSFKEFLKDPNTKSRNIDKSVSWNLVDWGKPYSPVSGKCQLCNQENYYPEMA